MENILITSALIQAKVEECKEITFVPFNIQSFNDGGEGGSGDGSDGSSGNGSGADGGEGGNQGGADDGGSGDSGNDDSGSGSSGGKTFTQEDITRIATKEHKQGQLKILKQLGYDSLEDAQAAIKAHNDYLESQKTEQQKKDEALQNFKKENKTLKQEHAAMQEQLAAMKAGIKPESVEDAIALAKLHVNEEVDFDQAMKQVLEKYPAFAMDKADNNSGTQKPPKFSAGQHQGGTEPTMQDQFMEAFKGMVPTYGNQK